VSVSALESTAVSLRLTCAAAGRGLGRDKCSAAAGATLRLPVLSSLVAALRARGCGGSRLWRFALVRSPARVRESGGAGARVRNRASQLRRRERPPPAASVGSVRVFSRSRRPYSMTRTPRRPPHYAFRPAFLPVNAHAKSHKGEKHRAARDTTVRATPLITPHYWRAHPRGTRA